jgi:hypothetical protein
MPVRRGPVSMHRGWAQVAARSRPTVGAVARCPARITSAAMPQRLRRPPQRQHRITGLVRLGQRHQGRQQTPAGFLSPQPPRHRDRLATAFGQRLCPGSALGHAFADSGVTDLCRPRDRAYAFVTEERGPASPAAAAAVARSGAGTGSRTVDPRHRPELLRVAAGTPLRRLPGQRPSPGKGNRTRLPISGWSLVRSRTEGSATTQVIRLYGITADVQKHSLRARGGDC